MVKLGGYANSVGCCEDMKGQFYRVQGTLVSTRPGESSSTYWGSSQFAKHLGIERVVSVLKIWKLRPREAKRSVSVLRTVCGSGLRELRAFGSRGGRMSGYFSTSLLDLPQGPGPIGIQCQLPFENNLFYPFTPRPRLHHILSISLPLNPFYLGPLDPI